MYDNLSRFTTKVRWGITDCRHVNTFTHKRDCPINTRKQLLDKHGVKRLQHSSYFCRSSACFCSGSNTFRRSSATLKTLLMPVKCLKTTPNMQQSTDEPSIGLNTTTLRRLRRKSVSTTDSMCRPCSQRSRCSTGREGTCIRISICNGALQEDRQTGRARQING